MAEYLMEIKGLPRFEPHQREALCCVLEQDTLSSALVLVQPTQFLRL